MSRPTYTYVVQVGDDGPVKVGSSVDPRRRLAELQRECPYALTVVWIVEGGRELERHVHRQLEGWRLHHEWYSADTLVPLRLLLDGERVLDHVPDAQTEIDELRKLDEDDLHRHLHIDAQTEAVR